MKTVYYVQTFSYVKVGKKGKTRLQGDQPLQMKTAQDAIGRAERFADKKVGVIAAAQEFDEVTGEYGNFTLLARYGTVPEMDDVF